MINWPWERKLKTNELENLKIEWRSSFKLILMGLSNNLNLDKIRLQTSNETNPNVNKSLAHLPSNLWRKNIELEHFHLDMRSCGIIYTFFSLLEATCAVNCSNNNKFRHFPNLIWNLSNPKVLMQHASMIMKFSNKKKSIKISRWYRAIRHWKLIF